MTHTRIATITLDRQDRRNALDPAALDELALCWRRAEEDEQVRAVVLTGAGEVAFSSGADLKASWEGVGPMHEAFFPEHTLRKPLIAAVNGACVAGGTELLLACDIAVASRQATFGLPEPTLGLFPAGGSAVRAPRRLGWKPAMHLLLTGSTIDADAALRIGLVNEVVEPAAVLARAHEIAARIAANSPVAVRAIKECAMETDGMPLLEALERQREYSARVSASPELREGLRSFREKRPPIF